jgi:hypothetical protein
LKISEVRDRSFVPSWASDAATRRGWLGRNRLVRVARYVVAADREDAVSLQV